MSAASAYTNTGLLCFADAAAIVSHEADSLAYIFRLARWRCFAASSAILAIICAVLVLLGWAFDLPVLTSILPGAATMKGNTATGFMLAGAALWLLATLPVQANARADWRSRLAAGCSGAVSALGAVTLAQDIFGVDFGIDNLVVAVAHPRMAPATATAFTLLGLALLLRDARQRRPQVLAESCALVAALIGLIALLGYAYGVESLYRVYGYSSMAIHTALLFVLLGLAALSVRPAWGMAAIITSDYGGGLMARRILPFAIGLPFVLGWLRLQGEQLGLYGSGFGLALFATSNILIFVTLVLINARMVNHLDARRHAASTASSASEQRLRNIIDGLGPSMFVGLLSTEGLVLEANKQALAAAGLTAEEVLGKPVEETYWFSYAVEIKQQMREAVVRAAQGIASRYDVQIQVAKNQFIPLDFSLQPFHDPSGKVVLLVPSAIVITERKQAETALREREELLQLFVEHSPAAVGMFDNEMRYMVVSRRWINDYHLGDQNILGRSHYQIFPEIPQRWKDIHQRCLAGATERCEEDLFVRADGRTDWVKWEVCPWHKADGRIGGIIIFSESITEHKLAEVALRESEERLRLALDAAHMGTFDWDIPHDKITWSRWHEELWGFQPGKFGNTYAAFAARVHADDLPGINAEVDRCIAAQEAFVHEFRVVWPDASIHWIAARGEFTFAADGQPLRMRGAVVEITERKLAEVALRKSEDHFRTVFEQAPDGILISDAQGNLLDANTAGCQQLAYSREELLQLHIADIIAAEEMPRLAAEIVRLKEEHVTQSEWRLRRSDGSTFPAQVAAKQLSDGRLQAFVHDITERKQAEETIRADSRQLQALSKRVLEVQEAERRHVARELHDELGQILTAIKINLQARNRLAGQSPVEIDSANIAMVDQAIAQVRRLALALRPSMLDDLGLMATLRWSAEQTLQRAGLAVQWHGDLHHQRLAPEIETACYRIAQEAFTNIVRYAQAQSVMITLQHNRERLLLTVHDDGCGFDVGAMRSRATAGGSVGVLGMQERAALVGGKMKIESVPGHGTIIRARFPWREREEAV